MSSADASHKQILEAIKSYVVRRPPYATLITGGWGSGKTHFFRNVVMPAINALPAASATTAAAEKSKKKGSAEANARRNVIYVSLFGIASVDDLMQRTVEGKYKFLQSGVMKATEFAIHGTLKFARLDGLLDKAKSFITLDAESDVLCFDDLERCDEKLIVQVLGRISNYVEHQRVPVVLMANEAEIKSEDYGRFKEKLIGASYFFRPDMLGALRGIVSETPFKRKETAELLGSPLVEHLVTKLAATPNLRLLRIALERFDAIDAIAVNKDVADQYRRAMLAACLGLVWEIGSDLSIAPHVAEMLSFAVRRRTPDRVMVHEETFALEAARRITATLVINDAKTPVTLGATYGFIVNGLLSSEVENEIEHLSSKNRRTGILDMDYWRVEPREFDKEVVKLVASLCDPAKKSSLPEILRVSNQLALFADKQVMPTESPLQTSVAVFAEAEKRIGELLAASRDLHDTSRSAGLALSSPLALNSMVWLSETAASAAFAETIEKTWRARQRSLSQEAAARLVDDILVKNVDSDSVELSEPPALYTAPLIQLAGPATVADLVMKAKVEAVDTFDRFLAVRDKVALAADNESAIKLASLLRARLSGAANALTRVRVQQLVDRLEKVSKP